MTIFPNQMTVRKGLATRMVVDSHQPDISSICFLLDALKQLEAVQTYIIYKLMSTLSIWPLSQQSNLPIIFNP